MCGTYATPRNEDRGASISPNRSKIQTEERRFLEQAIELAERGRGSVSPNPVVGAVIVQDGRKIGSGWHARYGDPHAEIEALSSCEGSPIGATMYVSLEPCCHQGKTPACTDAIVEAQIARVVIASDDPTDKASGRGPGILRDEGIEVDWAEGDLATRARLVNQPFRKHSRCGRPYVRFKSAVTLDGKVATRAGESHWISGESSRALVHQWRAEADAICIGVGTAIADDPMLTARVDDADIRQPVRVIFDSEASLPLESKLVKTATEVPVTVVVSRAASRASLERLESAGVRIVVASGQNEAARVRSAMQELGAEGIQSVLLEGGPHLAGAFIDSQEVDELCMFIAPLILGGRQARVMVEGEGSERLADGIRALSMEAEQVGEDVLVKARIKEW